MAKIEEKVEELVKEKIENIGYSLYDVEYAKEGKNYFLRIFIDSKNGIDLDDCEKVNNEIMEDLDNANYIKEQYFLEVSSPGIERILRKEKHLEQNIGNEIAIKLFKKDEEGKKEYLDAKIDADKMGIMLFTSGTTAMSKAVMLSHKNLVTNVMDIIQRFDLYEDDRFLSFLPLHHVFECTVGFLYPISIGGSIAFCEGVKHMADNIKEFGITAMISVPAVFDIIYRKVMKTIEKKGKMQNLEKGKKISQLLLKVKIDLRKQLFKEVHESLGPKLRLVVTGGAALDSETEKGFNDLGFDVEQGYGLTETAPVIAAETPKCRRLGSIGKKFPSVEVKIDNPDEEGIGELMAKGSSIMLGYYENEEATKAALDDDGWFHTGDLARIDKDGFIYISGRKKSVIVLNNGKNVFPEEIETLLNKVEGIKESFVYEKKENDGDVKVCVEIVYDKELIKELYNIDGEESIKEFLWEKVKEVNKLMPKYKYVREMIITEEPLVKTTTLKIKRHEELKKVLNK